MIGILLSRACPTSVLALTIWVTNTATQPKNRDACRIILSGQKLQEYRLCLYVSVNYAILVVEFPLINKTKDKNSSPRYESEY